MIRPLRIVFLGTPEFAVPSLQALLRGPHQVVAVVCQPDKPRGRGKVLSPPPIKMLAAESGLPILQPSSVRTEEFHAELKGFAPDVLVVVAYGKILPTPLLELPRLGAINVHGSLLPHYRGAAPIQWAVINGDKETGITIMQMDAGMDTGAILCQVTTAIGPEETSGDLFIRLAQLGGETLGRALDQLNGGLLKPRAQEHSSATTAPMLRKEMGHLDWRLPAQRLHSLMRGLDPWPSAYGFINETRYRFFRPDVVTLHTDAEPGTLLRADDLGLLVATGEHCLRIQEIQPEGKKRMEVATYLRGASFSLPLRIS